MRRWFLLGFVAVFSLILAACNGEDSGEGGDDTGGDSGNGGQDDSEEEVTMMDGDEQEIGTATLTEGDEGVTIDLDLENLPEGGEHGFHIHNAGVCEGPAFDSAGDHYNPTDANHGFDDPDGPHAGDLENIQVSEDGTVDTEVTADMVTLEEGAETTLQTEEGTSLIIHSDADDYESQPSGDAGDPIACGVINAQ